MAVLQLEDLTGSCEAVVFPKTHARLADHLMVDARLLVWGSVDRRDERVQLIVEDCRSIDDLQRPVFYIAGVVGVIVLGVVAYAIWKFKDRGQDIPEQSHGNPKLEIALTILPAIILAAAS